jgi:glycosyltransferase involved in cell wall biosynthesis
MHVINAMFSAGLGGIEQSFLDCCACLKNHGHKVTVIIHPKAQVRQALVGLQVNIVNVKNLGIFDIFAKSYLKKILKQTRSDVIIAHGNRASCLLKGPARNIRIPLVGVTHNYKLERQIGLDAMFATTNSLKQHLIELGQDENTIFKVPNMVRLHSKELPVMAYRTPPVIGTMGRFIKKKGFDYFLRSLAKLKERNIAFKALIGGSGEEEKELKELANALGLSSMVEFLGWVDNKSKLFDNIDIFVLPSIHEPFGIILLEAFARGKVVVTTDSEGPLEIAHHKKDALIVPKGDSAAIANAIELLLNDWDIGRGLSKNAFETVKKYDADKVGEVMNIALLKIVQNYKM